MRRVVSAVAIVLLVAACEVNDPASWVEQQHAQDMARFADDPDVLLRLGLLADRKHRYVDFLAYASGATEDSRIDVLIAGHDSESSQALARAVVTAAELQDALQFIGLAAGHPIDVGELLYWPKGERVTASFYWDEDDTGRFDTVVVAEDLVIDTRWNAPLPKLGFRFVGPAAGILAATEIITTYNAANTLLEVPYTVDHDNVAGRLSANPEHLFSPQQRLRIRLRPEYQGDRRRVRNYVLEVATGNGNGQLPSLSARLIGAESEQGKTGTFSDVFVYLQEKIANGEEPFVQLRFSDEITAASVRDVATFASRFLVEQQIRIEPLATEPYISAFLPQPAWRDPARRGRSSQPLEIHLQDGNMAGELFQYAAGGNFERQGFAGMTELSEILRNGKAWQTDGVFLFVAPGTPYGQIKSIFSLVKQHYENFYVFL